MSAGGKKLYILKNMTFMFTADYVHVLGTLIVFLFNTLSCCVHSKHKEVLFQFLWNKNALPVCKSFRKALKFFIISSI
jgi:hypothetical protein